MTEEYPYTTSSENHAAQSQPQPGYAPYQYPYAPQPQQPYVYPQPYPTYQPTPIPGRGKGTAALVMGICAIVLAWTFILLPVTVGLGIAGAILGYLSYKEAKQAGVSAGLGIGGLVTSIVGAVMSIALLVLSIWLISTMFSMVGQYEQYQILSSNSNNSSYNSNLNVSSNSNEDEDDAITNISGANAAITPWDAFTFELDGYKVKLGETKLSDVVNNTTWNQYVDPAASDADIPGEGKTIEIVIVRKDMPQQGQIAVSLENKSGKAEKIDDLVIGKVMVDGINLDEGAEINAIFPGSAKIGSSEQAVTRNLETPDKAEGPTYNRKCTWGDPKTGSLQIEFSSTGAYRISYDAIGEGK